VSGIQEDVAAGTTLTPLNSALSLYGQRLQTEVNEEGLRRLLAADGVILDTSGRNCWLRVLSVLSAESFHLCIIPSVMQ